MPSKQKTPKVSRVEDKIDDAPTIDELVDQVTEAPSIEEIAAQAPVEQTEPEPAVPLELPLEALGMIIWIGPNGERMHMEPWRTRGEYQLRPYFGD